MKYFSKLKLKSSVEGFTLVELMVVIALFTTIMMAAIGALFSAQAVNTKLQQTQIILDGANLAVEEMVRDIRYGSTFYCTDNSIMQNFPQVMPDRLSCSYPNGNTVLIFKPGEVLSSASLSQNDRIAYYISNGALFKKSFPGGDRTIPAIQVTASDIVVNDLTFYVRGAETNSALDYIQPVVTLSLSGITKPNSPNVEQVKFSVQTTSSTRKIDK